MEQTKPMPSKLQPLFESIVDCSTIGLGLGIFAKYAPIWINDPTSRSGIILAGVLNATALGIANYLTIDEKTPYLHKIVITVITLTATALATPYFALALKDRFMIILTPNVAFQMAGLNLAVKTIYYTVAYFGSQKTGQIEEIEHFSDVKIQEKYESFKTPDGKIKWMEQTEEVRLKYLKAFYDNDCSFFAFDNDTFKKMYVPVSEVIIKNITKPQASWIHNILTSREPLELQDDVAKNYVTLFYNNEFPPLPNLDNFTLPIEECDVAHLNPTQVAWHKKFTKNDATWNLFSLELKDKLNKKFVESGLEANPLRLSPGEIRQAPFSLVEQLLPQSDKDWLGSSLEMQEALNESLIHNDMDPFTTHPKTVQEVNLLDEDMVFKYHQIYAQQLCSHQFSDEMQIAFSTRFLTLNLPRPTSTWKFDYKIPSSEMEFNGLSALQLNWHYSYFSSNQDKWRQLELPQQIAYTKLFSNLGKMPFFYYPSTSQEIKDVNDPTITKALHIQSNIPEFWNNLTLEIQTALNNHFTNKNLTTIQVTKGSPQTWKDCSPKFQRDIAVEWYQYFQTNEGTLYWLNNINEEQDQVAYLNAFFKQSLPVFNFSNDFFAKLTVSTDPEEIKKYTRTQTEWLHYILSDKEPIALSPEASQAYVDLFINAHALPLPKFGNKQRILPENFKLPILQSRDEIEKLEPYQVEWYKVFTQNVDHWKSFSLENQVALNTKFNECKLNQWHLEPSSVGDTQNASDLIIQQLVGKYKDQPNLWNNCSNEIKIALSVRFSEFFQTKVGKPAWATPETSRTLATWLYPLLYQINSLTLPNKSFEFYFNLFYINDLKPLPNIKKENYTAFFGTINLNVTIDSLTSNQVHWYKHYTAISGNFTALPLQSQFALNQKFSAEGLQECFLRPSTPDEINNSPQPVIQSLAAQYQYDPNQWKLLPLKFQDSLNVKFVENGISQFALELSSVDEINVLPESIIRKLATQYEQLPEKWLELSIHEQDALNNQFTKNKIKGLNTHPQKTYQIRELSEAEIRSYHTLFSADKFDMRDEMKTEYCKRFKEYGLQFPDGWTYEEPKPSFVASLFNRFLPK